MAHISLLRSLAMHHGGAHPWRLQRWFRFGATVIVACAMAFMSVLGAQAVAFAQDDDDTGGGRGARDEAEQPIDDDAGDDDADVDDLDDEADDATDEDSDVDCGELSYSEAITADCPIDRVGDVELDAAAEPLRGGDTELSVESESSDSDEGASSGADSASASADSASDGPDGESDDDTDGGRVGLTSDGGGNGTSVALGIAAAGLVTVGGLLAAGRRRRAEEPLITPVDGDITPPAALPDEFAYDATQERVAADPAPIDGEGSDPAVQIASPPAAVVLPPESDVAAAETPVVEIPGVEIPGIDIPGIDPDETA